MHATSDLGLGPAYERRREETKNIELGELGEAEASILYPESSLVAADAPLGVDRLLLSGVKKVLAGVHWKTEQTLSGSEENEDENEDEVDIAMDEIETYPPFLLGTEVIRLYNQMQADFSSSPRDVVISMHPDVADNVGEKVGRKEMKQKESKQKESKQDQKEDRMEDVSENETSTSTSATKTSEPIKEGKINLDKEIPETKTKTNPDPDTAPPWHCLFCGARNSEYKGTKCGECKAWKCPTCKKLWNHSEFYCSHCRCSWKERQVHLPVQ